MKVTDPQPPASDPNVNADDFDSSQDTDNDDASAFAQVLAKKREAEQDSAQSKSKHAEGALDPAAAGLAQPQVAFEQSLQAAPVESKRAVGVPIALQELVREISVATDAAGKQQVHIELNSNVLKGLHIVVERQDGAVAIQFQSASDEVARLLSRNSDALAQGLTDRGVSVADIHITGPGESARVRDDKARSNFGGSWQRRGQGSKR